MKAKIILGPAVLFSLFLAAVFWLGGGERYFFNQAFKAQSSTASTPSELALKYAQKITPKDIAPLNFKPEFGFLELPILMYHHVGSLPEGADALRRDLTVSAENFAGQMAWLKQQGYTALSLDQVYAVLRGSLPAPKKALAITFDDGYDETFEAAVPILRQYGFAGSFGIITGFAGSPGYASWQQIAQAQSQGMEIVCHTQNHFDGGNAKKYPSAYVRANLAGCRRDLAEHLGAASDILIYPYGHYTDEYIKVAQGQGFVMGLTVHFGRNLNPKDLMRIPRVRVHGRETLETFEKLLTE